MLFVFKLGMGGNKLVGESVGSTPPPLTKGEVCFMPANGGRVEAAAVLLLFLVCCWFLLCALFRGERAHEGKPRNACLLIYEL